MRQRMNVYLPPGLLHQVADLAACKKLSRSAIMEAAAASFLSPDGADRREAAFTRRLDRLTRQVQRLERPRCRDRSVRDHRSHHDTAGSRNSQPAQAWA